MEMSYLRDSCTVIDVWNVMGHEGFKDNFCILCMYIEKMALIV